MTAPKKSPVAKKLPVEKLDTSRPYGEVYGDTTHNQAFAQRALGINSWPYDAQGDLIEAALNDEQKKKLKERRDHAAKQPVEVEIKDEQPADQLDDNEKDGTEQAKEPEDDEVNLTMWLKGDARYKPFEIQNAVKKRYGANKPKLSDAALFLVEEKHLVPRALVHPSILPVPQAA